MNKLQIFSRNPELTERPITKTLFFLVIIALIGYYIICVKNKEGEINLAEGWEGSTEELFKPDLKG